MPSYYKKPFSTDNRLYKKNSLLAIDDISDYNPSAGCITCTGELQISNLASCHPSEATVGNSKSTGEKRALSIVA
jgi:hypothetical protein